MIYIGEVEKEIVGFGVFKPGDQIDYNETLFSTGLFKMKPALEVVEPEAPAPAASEPVAAPAEQPAAPAPASAPDPAATPDPITAPATDTINTNGGN